MNIFGIGLPEMALIFIVALLIFGPKKLPEIGRSLGKAMKSFQDASKEFETEFKREAEQIQKVVEEPMKAVIDSPKAIAPSEDGVKEEAEEKTDDTSADMNDSTDVPEADVVTADNSVDSDAPSNTESASV